MDNILLAATTIIVIVLAAAELMKRYAGAESKWLPLINLLTGLIVGIAWSLSFAPDDLIVFVWGGLIAGLAAGGFYDLGSGLIRKDEK